jgi:carbon starvation protein
VQRKLAPPLWLLTLIFVPATLLAVWAGTKLSTVLLLDGKSWGLVICVYCFVAALLPVWLLLQPRGYLGGFILYLSLGFGVVGLFFGGAPIAQPAFKGWGGPSATSALLPFLFVTIACGACSGFHGLVCSGTTSKQIKQESDCKPVGYGAMLLEAFVALIALGTIMTVAPEDVAGRGPGRIYGDGLGRAIAMVFGEEHLVFARTFGAMAFSTFVFDTIDVATRLGRYILEELFGWQRRPGLRGMLGTAGATALTIAPPAVVLMSVTAAPGQPPAYMKFWTLFGTSNQLLAALTLMGVAMWLWSEGRRVWFVVLPMFFVFGITVWALVVQVAITQDWVLRTTAAALLALAALVSWEVYAAFRRGRPPSGAVAAG